MERTPSVGRPVLDGVEVDEQQLYDWGIENRLDQYYQENNANGYQDQQQYVPNNPNLHYQHDPQTYFDPQPLQYQHRQLTPPPTPNAKLGVSEMTIVSGCNNNGSARDASITEDRLVVKMEPEETLLPRMPIQTAASNPPHFVRNSSGRRPTLPQVDMDANEILKVERKRARNRVAASKCRLRKLERIAVLDQQAQQLRAENDEMSTLVEKLKSQVYNLKQELKWHVNNGCKVFGSSKAPSASPDSTTPASAQKDFTPFANVPRCEDAKIGPRNKLPTCEETFCT